MARPIGLEVAPRDPREELRKRLEAGARATRGSAARIV